MTPSPPTGAPARSLSRTAYEIESQGELWSRYLPRDDPGTNFVGGVYTLPWIRTVQDIASLDNTTGLAVNALATSILGRARSDSALLQESTNLYARALRRTNRALQDPDQAQSDAVLACCKVLAMSVRPEI